MKKVVIILSIMVLPFVSAFITYALVVVGNPPIELDENQSLILWIAILKLVLLGSSGVFPIDVNEIVHAFMTRETRDEFSPYVVPPVHKFPCTRRLLCETEAVARSSDSYLNEGPLADNDRNLEEEINPAVEDPIKAMHIEAVKAFYRDDDKSGELTESTKKALEIVEGLTGNKCEEAYRKCQGRFTPSAYIRAIFEEIQFKVKEEL